MSGALGCYHVAGSDGGLYGVAATSKRDALVTVQERMDSDGAAARPVSAVRVSSCDWAYGTVVRYS